MRRARSSMPRHGHRGDPPRRSVMNGGRRRAMRCARSNMPQHGHRGHAPRRIPWRGHRRQAPGRREDRRCRVRRTSRRATTMQARFRQRARTRCGSLGWPTQVTDERCRLAGACACTHAPFAEVHIAPRRAPSVWFGALCRSLLPGTNPSRTTSQALDMHLCRVAPSFGALMAAAPHPCASLRLPPGSRGGFTAGFNLRFWK